MRFSSRAKCQTCGTAIAIGLVLLSGFASTMLAEPSGSGQLNSDKVSFDRDVRPILSNHCWKCHGPDANERKAGLRLDQRESAIKPAESGTSAISPIKPGDSELLRRVLSLDADQLMPPA